MALRFTLRQLEYFVAVGKCGSIALAAAKVNVSSPSISAAISQLEAEFGLQLFVRRHALGLSLTQAGRQFLERAERILAEATALNTLANDISGHVRGPLSIGCLLTFAQLMVPMLRRKFEERYREVQVRQHELDQHEIFAKLRGAEIDVALTYDLEIPPDLTFIPLVELPPFALLAQSHPLAEQSQVSVAELAKHPMVLLDLPNSRDYFLQLFAKINARPHIAERTRDMAVMRSLVANGFGYSIANVRPLSDLAPDGLKLCFVPLAGEVQPLRMGLAMAEGAQNVLTVRAFVDHCRALISADSVPGMRMGG
ncbi:MAG: LysR substrate-binding domain-containing protein [Albidovulum sp.]